MRYSLLGLLCILIIGIGTISPLIAQDETIITLTVDEWMENAFTPRVFENFYADHPGVKVVVVPSSQDNYYPPAAYSPDDHFDGVTRFVAQGDVLLVNSYQIGVESTRSGAFLDLSPLVVADSTLDTSDFFPALWKSFTSHVPFG